MAAPEYVPVLPQDRPRRAEQLPPADRWVPDRPGDFVLTKSEQPRGPRLGSQGPDLGYALTLLRRFEGRLQLTAHEHPADVDAGCVQVAMKRASVFGRAPMIYDVELGYGVFGFLDEHPPAELVDFRRRLFDGARHHYEFQRAIADAVPESTLGLTPAQVRERLSDWRSLLVL